MIHAILALTLRAAFGVRYGIHAFAVRPDAMDGVNVENAGAVFCRPPCLLNEQDSFPKFRVSRAVGESMRATSMIRATLARKIATVRLAQVSLGLAHGRA
jgi:hypothetical protein